MKEVSVGSNAAAAAAASSSLSETDQKTQELLNDLESETHLQIPNIEESPDSKYRHVSWDQNNLNEIESSKDYGRQQIPEERTPWPYKDSQDIMTLDQDLTPDQVELFSEKINKELSTMKAAHDKHEQFEKMRNEHYRNEASVLTSKNLPLSDEDDDDDDEDNA
ncbi:MAG: hypothetical protein MHMPM18_000155 [Marteilia pararefringens]